MAKKLRKFWTKEDRLFVTISETGSRNDYHKREYAQEENGLEARLMRLFTDIMLEEVIVSERSSSFLSVIKSVQYTVMSCVNNTGKYEDFIYDENGSEKIAHIAAEFLTKMYFGEKPIHDEDWQVFELAVKAQNAENVAAYKRKYLEYRQKEIVILYNVSRSIFDGYAVVKDNSGDVWLMPNDIIKDSVLVDNSDRSAVRVTSINRQFCDAKFLYGALSDKLPLAWTKSTRRGILCSIIWEEAGRIPSGLTYDGFCTDGYGITEK